MDYNIFLTLVSYFVRFIGLLVFGVAIGWFTLYAYRELAQNWQLKIAVFLGFLAFSAALVRFESAGAEGAYVLGTGAAMLIWGLRQSNKTEQAAETEAAKPKKK
jgi:hypothetical protein